MKEDVKIHIDTIDDKLLQGWFINTSNNQENKLLLHLDGQYKAVTLANLERQDVADVHGQLHAGFCFDIKKFVPFKKVTLYNEKKEVLLDVAIKRKAKKQIKKIDHISPYSQQNYTQLTELYIDLSRPINGENWYSTEPNGCWTGPLLESSLNIPALAKGAYQLQLEILNDFCDLSELKLFLNDKQIIFLNTEFQSPCVLLAKITVEKNQPFWQLKLNHSKTCPPEGDSGADQRQLGLFLKSVHFSKLDS